MFKRGKIQKLLINIVGMFVNGFLYIYVFLTTHKICTFYLSSSKIFLHTLKKWIVYLSLSCKEHDNILIIRYFII